jgi:hypothetical protein
MELWDEMMRPLKPEFDRLAPSARLRCAVTVIRWTMEHSRPPIQQGAAAEFLAEALSSFEPALQQGVNAVSRTAEMDDRIELVLAAATEPGASNLVMACVQSYATGGEIEGKALYNVFGSCYNAVLEQEFSGPFIDIEDEEGNPRCRDTIEFQQVLLQQSL